MGCSTPCEWPIDRACLPELPALPDNPTAQQRETYDLAEAAQYGAEDLAVQVLWALSGRQYGTCPATVRPCPPGWSMFDPLGRGRNVTGINLTSYVLSFEGDRWVNWPCGCPGRCTLSGPRAVHLPGPAARIITVTIGAGTLPPTDYTLEGDTLYRISGPWPGQDLGEPAGEDGTWSVRYLRGHPPPAGTAKFVGTLAAEFLKACSGDKCRLPRTVTVANRNGVTYRAYDPTAIYSDGKTGIPEIDLWLAAVNPNHLAAAPSVI